MIEIKNISKKYGRQQVLDNITISFERNQSVALIGPNGSGKTTIIKTILGMVIPDSGTLTVNGENVRGHERYRRIIGYMPQISRFPENMTVRHLFQLMKDLRKEDGKSMDEELYNTYDLRSFEHKTMKTLSGGMRQKTSAALAFLFNPQIIILDEPTAGLDPLSVEILKSKIKKEKGNGKVVLITSHILSDLDEIISDVVYLQEGTIRLYHTLEELMQRTGESKVSKAIAHWMMSGGENSNGKEQNEQVIK